MLDLNQENRLQSRDGARRHFSDLVGVEFVGDLAKSTDTACKKRGYVGQGGKVVVSMQGFYDVPPLSHFGSSNCTEKLITAHCERNINCLVRM